jgi:pilus assembly protein FimV
MRQRPEYLVWIEIAGIVGLLALLLGPLAYLATEMAGSLGGSGGEPIATRASGPTGPGSPARVPRASAPRSAPVLSGSRSGGGEAAPTPFSDQWQAQATPALTGPDGGTSVGRGLGDGRPESGIAATRSSGAQGSAPKIGRSAGATPSVGVSPPAGVRIHASGNRKGGPVLATRGPPGAAGSSGGAGQVAAASRAGDDRDAAGGRASDGTATGAKRAAAADRRSPVAGRLRGADRFGSRLARRSGSAKPGLAFERADRGSPPLARSPGRAVGRLADWSRRVIPDTTEGLDLARGCCGS